MNMPEVVKQVEWDHLHKIKYFSYNSVFMFSLETVLYPVAVVRTRLQVQRTDKLYKSTWDAFAKMSKFEGIRGLYRGFLVGQLGIITGGVYFTSYEVSRKKLSSFDEASRGFVAGFVAAVLEQCVGNPLQVVTQRRMLEGQTPGQTKLKGSGKIALDVYRKHGPKGLYRGFLASLFALGLDSALWWGWYGVFLEAVGHNVPEGSSHIAVQATAGALSGFTTTVIGNPLDVLKTRIQVEGRRSIKKVLSELLRKEGALALTKGMLPNLAISVPTSVCAICGYETVKWLSLKDEMVHYYQ